MSTYLNVDDICSEADCLALDAEAVTGFQAPGQGSAQLASKRAYAVNNWLVPRLVKAGYSPGRLCVRRDPDLCYLYPGALDVTQQLSTLNPLDDFDLSLLASAAHYLYIGSRWQFKGLHATILDAPNQQAAAASYSYWDGGQWRAFSGVTDRCLIAGVPFAGGGNIQWTAPSDWQKRPINPAVTADFYYWSRISLSVQPSTSARLSQLLPIRVSRLTGPTATHALSLHYREAHVGNRGEWGEKAKEFREQAQTDLDLVLGMIADEFDMDDSQSVGATEVNQVPASAGDWTWERG